MRWCLLLIMCLGCDDGGGEPSDAGALDVDLTDTGIDPTPDAAEDASRADRGVTPVDASPPDMAMTADAAPDVAVEPAGPCVPLPPSDGTEIRLTPDRADELPQIVRDAMPGTVILLEDGTYRIGPDGEGNRRLQFHRPGVTLRSVSDDATRVIIDGEYRTNEIAFINADDVTIAHITITHAVDHGIHVTAPGGGGSIRNTVLYGLRLIDHGEQFVKVNANGERTGWADDGRLECSFFQLTDEGRTHIERCCGGCYTGGIDTHGGRGWVIRRNRFEDIYCAGEGLAEHAVHFWSAARDTLVEHNVILNCARGIGFGLVQEGADRPYPDDPYPEVGYIGHYDGVIRGNFIWADHAFYDTGIELAQAHGARVYHNTVVSDPATTPGWYSSIDYRFPNSDVVIRNNIVRRITMRNDAVGDVGDNLEGASLDLFVDPAAGDLHLKPTAAAAIDQAVVVDGAGLDIDGERRSAGAGPDLGADEVR